MSNIKIYQAPNIKIKLEVTLEDETLLLNQKQFYELFSRLKSTITKLLIAISDDKELGGNAVVWNFRTVQKESEVKRDMELESIVKGAINDHK